MAWIRGPQPSDRPGVPAPSGPCVFCEAVQAADDRRWLVVHRSEHAYLILNAYPYAPGHVMAVLNRHVGSLAEADARALAAKLANAPPPGTGRQPAPKGGPAAAETQKVAKSHVMSQRSYNF